jgi:hypothetical protein
MRYATIFQITLILIGLCLGLFILAAIGLLVGLGGAEALLSLRRYALIGLALASIAAVAYSLYWRRQQIGLNRTMAAAGRTFSLAPRLSDVPPSCDFWRRAPVGFLPRHGDALCSHISFEVNGDSQAMLFTLRAPTVDGLDKHMAAEVAVEWPKTEMRSAVQHRKDIPSAHEGETFVDPPHTRAQEPGAHIFWQELRPLKHHAYPLHTSEPDPRSQSGPGSSQAATLLAALNTLPADAQAGIQLLVRPAPRSVFRAWRRVSNNLQNQLNQRGSKMTGNADHTVTTNTQFGPSNEAELRQNLARVANRLRDEAFTYEVCLRVWSVNPHPAQARREVKRIGKHITAALRGRLNELTEGRNGRDWETVLTRCFPFWGGFMMTATELGQFMRLPGAAAAAPFAKLHRAGANPLPPEGRIIVEPHEVITVEQLNDRVNGRPAANKRAYGTFVDASGQQLLIGHSFAATTTHGLVTGSTGTGKSVAAANMALQDWLSGAGVLVLDPHGSLIDDILRGVPTDREKDVVILDPADPQPFRFNVCQVNHDLGLDVATENVMEAIRIGIGASWETSVGMREVLFNAVVLALGAIPQASMLDVAAVLDENKRAELLRSGSTRLPQVKAAADFWRSKFPSWNDRDQKQALAAAQRRIDAFVRLGILRRTIGSSGRSVNLAEAISRGCLILAPMPDEMGGEAKRIWGAILVREFIQVLRQRSAAGNASQRATLIVDEVADSIGTLAGFIKVIVTQLRKYGASAYFFAQNFSQLPEDVRQEMISNCRTQICFSAGVDDAQIAARILGEGVTAYDIQNLPPYHAFARLAVPGAQAQPALIRMLPPVREKEPPPWPGPAARQPLSSHLPQPGEAAPEKLQAGLPNKEIVAFLEKQASGRSDEVIKFLLSLPEERFEHICWVKRAYDQERRRRLLLFPGLVKDKVRRIRALSRYQYGVPWWMSDTGYYRQLNEDRGGRRERG